MVLLVDCRLNSLSGIKRRFGRVCESSTDFHFDDLTKQFDRIRSELGAVNNSRCEEEKDEKGALVPRDLSEGPQKKKS